MARHLKDPRPLVFAKLKWGGKIFHVADEAQLMKALHREMHNLWVYYAEPAGLADFEIKFEQNAITKTGRPIKFYSTLKGVGGVQNHKDMLHNIMFMQSPWYDSVRVNASRAIGMIRQHIMDEGAEKNPANGVMSSSLKLDYAANAARRIDAVAQLVSQWWAVHRCSIAGRCVDLGNHEEDNTLAISVNAGSECVQFCHTYLPGAQTVELRLNVLTK